MMFSQDISVFQGFSGYERFEKALENLQSMRIEDRLSTRTKVISDILYFMNNRSCCGDYYLFMIYILAGKRKNADKVFKRICAGIKTTDLFQLLHLKYLITFFEKEDVFEYIGESGISNQPFFFFDIFKTYAYYGDLPKGLKFLLLIDETDDLEVLFYRYFFKISPDIKLVTLYNEMHGTENKDLKDILNYMKKGHINKKIIEYYEDTQ